MLYSQQKQFRYSIAEPVYIKKIALKKWLFFLVSVLTAPVFLALQEYYIVYMQLGLSAGIVELCILKNLVLTLFISICFIGYQKSKARIYCEKPLFWFTTLTFFFFVTHLEKFLVVFWVVFIPMFFLQLVVSFGISIRGLFFCLGLVTYLIFWLSSNRVALSGSISAFWETFFVQTVWMLVLSLSTYGKIKISLPIALFISFFFLFNVLCYVGFLLTYAAIWGIYFKEDVTTFLWERRTTLAEAKSTLRRELILLQFMYRLSFIKVYDGRYV